MFPDVACAYIDAASPVAIVKMARLLKTLIVLLPGPVRGRILVRPRAGDSLPCRTSGRAWRVRIATRLPPLRNCMSAYLEGRSVAIAAREIKSPDFHSSV